MSGGTLVEDLRRYLRGVQSVQDEMASLYRRKRVALSQARAPELLQIAETETGLAKQLQGYVLERQQLLKRSAAAGVPARTLQDVVATFEAGPRAELEPQIARTRHLAEEVRRETWIHWIVAQRSLGHHRQLLDLVASCGRNSPTYSHRPGHETSGGGAILDASA